MPQLLAVDWDQHEARYVLGASSRGKLIIHAAATIPLREAGEDGQYDSTNVGRLLNKALAGEKVGRAVTLVGVSRADVELLELTVPPATDAELPELVENQTIRESQVAGEEAVIDFVSLSDNPAEPRKVTAVVISAERLQQVRDVCTAAGVRPSRVMPRQYPAASLFSQGAAAPASPCLLVNLFGGEADLSVVRGGRVLFSRTVRWSRAHGDDAGPEALLTEINRTLVVAPQSKYGQGEIESACIFGRADEHERLAEVIREELSLPATMCDVFEAVRAPRRLVADYSGRFAPLVGMLLDEARGEAHAVDLLHPREKPKPPDRRRRLLAVTALVATFGLFAWYYVWNTLSTIDAENEQIEQRLSDLDELVKEASQRKQLAGAIRVWNDANIIWLDELRDLSIRLPSQRDAVVLRMSLKPSRGGSGVIDLEGLVRDPSIVARMERSVRDEHHEVRSKRVQERLREKTYTWHFETSVSVAKREKSEYVSHLSNSPSEAENAAAAPASPATVSLDNP